MPSIVINGIILTRDGSEIIGSCPSVPEVWVFTDYYSAQHYADTLVLCDCDRHFREW